MRAAGGTSVPLMLDWLMWLSMPKVNAECEKPETQSTISLTNNSRNYTHNAQMFTGTSTITSPSVIQVESMRTSTPQQRFAL